MDLEARLGRGYSTFMWVCFVTLVPRQEGAMMSQTFRLAVASVLLFAVCLLPDWLHAQRSFRRGDVDDSGRINLSDPVRILQNLFGNREVGIWCRDAADADDDGKLELTDAVYLLNFLFRRGAPPPAPFPDCGKDRTQDPLSCGAVRCQNEGAPDPLLDPLFDPFDGSEAFVFVVDRSASMQDKGELTFRSRSLRERARR